MRQLSKRLGQSFREINKVQCTVMCILVSKLCLQSIHKQQQRPTIVMTVNNIRYFQMHVKVCYCHTHECAMIIPLCPLYDYVMTILSFSCSSCSGFCCPVMEEEAGGSTGTWILHYLSVVALNYQRGLWLHTRTQTHTAVGTGMYMLGHTHKLA